MIQSDHNLQATRDVQSNNRHSQTEIWIKRVIYLGLSII
jgi:hypothetical protein